MEGATKVAEAVAAVEEGATQKVVHETRVVDRIEIGECVRQGDIYIHRVADDHPHGEELKSHQLATGTTQGSRHVADEHAQVFAGTHRPEWAATTSLIGPFIRAARRLLVRHPEHADFDLPAGSYQVTHQLDPQTQRAVED